MDVTTSARSRRGQSNGTLRVERSYAAVLQELFGARLRFSHYRSTRGRFAALPGFPAAQPAAAASAGKGEKGLGLAPAEPRLTRRLERAVRQWSRASAARLFRRLDRGTGAACFPEAKPGDVLLLAGENWSRYDFEILSTLRREQTMRIAALCQDLIPLHHPQFFADDAFVQRYRSYADFLVEQCDLVIAISQSTRRDILAHASSRGGMRGRVEVVQLGSDFAPAANPAPPATGELKPRAFVLSVSTIQSRKNFDLLYRVWQRLSDEALDGLPTLVIVGRKGFGSGDLLWQISRDPSVRKSIRILHDVSDAQLAWLYQNCLWTLYPSFYEGWGLPVSESLAYGKFCLASNTSSLPEAGQGLVRHLDPLDVMAWRDAIVELLASPEDLQRHEAEIRAHYRPVSWAQSGKELADHLERLLARPFAR